MIQRKSPKIKLENKTSRVNKKRKKPRTANNGKCRALKIKFQKQ